tara:strand:+ start:244 stop:846 length:603 start_codon:yes stop_codon:yes gene_type:complete
MNKILIIISLLNFLAGEVKLPDFNLINWNSIQNDEIVIEYSEKNGIQWCRAYIESDFSIEKISRVLEDKANYPNVFDRITETIMYTDDIVHIKLDLPFPWAGRDYIVKYVQKTTKDFREYSFIHYDDLRIPVDEHYVRLNRAAGRWRLNQLPNGNTRIEYIWNGELLGDFPSWALKIAWKEQGNEVFTWLIDYMDETNDN